MHVLFVCTGNICRSPMAEGIARARHGDQATFSSAGTIAIRGSAPTGPARTAAAEIGVDISDLRAIQLNKALTPVPDHIYVMTRRHHERVVATLPRLAERVELLDPAGEVDDPYGSDLDVYRSVRDQIAAAIDLRSQEWHEPPA